MTEKLLCGVDIGGTKLSAGLYEQTGRQLARMEVHDHRGLAANDFADRIIGLLRDLLHPHDRQNILGIGVGFAGHVHFKRGVIVTSSNFQQSLKNYPLRDRIQKAFDLPVVLDNDANAQAYGEHRFGAGRNIADMVFLTVSSGIGAGIILGGRLLRGISGTAGELGHTIVKYDADNTCTCGNKGCIMSLASGLFFPELFRRKLQEGKTTIMGISPENLSEVNGELIAAGLRQGDPISREIAADSAAIVGIAVYNIFAMLNPQAVILGGGLMKLGHSYMEMIRTAFLSRTYDMMVDEMLLLGAELEDDAGLVGAAALTLEQASEQTSEQEIT